MATMKTVAAKTTQNGDKLKHNQIYTLMVKEVVIVLSLFLIKPCYHVDQACCYFGFYNLMITIIGLPPIHIYYLIDTIPFSA